jgi:hypothetical protein
MDLKNIKHFVLFDGNGWFHGINLLDNYKKKLRRKDEIVSETEMVHGMILSSMNTNNDL